VLHIVNERPLAKYPDGLQALHTADEDSVDGFTSLAYPKQNKQHPLLHASVIYCSLFSG